MNVKGSLSSRDRMEGEDVCGLWGVEEEGMENGRGKNLTLDLIQASGHHGQRLGILVSCLVKDLPIMPQFPRKTYVILCTIWVCASPPPYYLGGSNLAYSDTTAAS